MNKTDVNGVNAFFMAAWYNRLEAMRKLMSLRCDITAVNQNGSNALHIAVKQGSMDVVKELINLRTFLKDAEKRNGVTPFGIAAHRG